MDGDPKLGNITLIPLDKSGAAVPNLGLDFRPASMSDYSKLEGLLKGKVGKTVIISFEWDYFSDKDIQKRIMEETESFEITNADFTGLGNDSDAYSMDDEEDEDDDSISSASGTQNWDEFLNSYETYIDQYIKLMKKVNNGDLTVMNEYSEMMEKATEFSEKLESAGSNLSTSQLSRFTKLQTKLSQAAMNMQ